MNYFDKHIGDWIKDTVKLSMLEEGAYSRLIDQYYQTERPLPLDRKELYRAARATSTAERKAVDYVVQTYFERTDEGLVQKRCQEVIEQYWERDQAEGEKREQKKAADRERQQRTRERRKALFEALRQHGIVPEFNTPTKELSRILSRVTVGDESQDGHKSVTRDNTANPIPNPQSPSLNQQPPSQATTETREDEPPGRSGPDDYLPDPTPSGALSRTLRQLGVVCMPNTEELVGWLRDGFDADELTAALEIVRQTKPRPQPVPARYLDTTVRRLREEAAKPKAAAKPRDDWHRSDAGTDRKARELGMFAHGGESYDAFRQRIWAEIKRRETATSQGAA